VNEPSGKNIYLMGERNPFALEIPRGKKAKIIEYSRYFLGRNEIPSVVRTRVIEPVCTTNK